MAPFDSDSHHNFRWTFSLESNRTFINFTHIALLYALMSTDLIESLFVAEKEITFVVFSEFYCMLPWVLDCKSLWE